MTKQEFALCLKILNDSGLANSPNIDEDLGSVWFMFFRQHYVYDLVAAIIYYIGKNKFYPQVADLLENIRKIREFCSIMPPERAWDSIFSNLLDERVFRAADEANISLYLLKNHPEDYNMADEKAKFDKAYAEKYYYDMGHNETFKDIAGVIGILETEKSKGLKQLSIECHIKEK